jgi:hypothetical protein
MDVGSQSLDVGRQSSNVGRQSLNVSRQSSNVGRQSLDVSRQSLNVGSQSSNVGRQSCEMGKKLRFNDLITINNSNSNKIMTPRLEEYVPMGALVLKSLKRDQADFNVYFTGKDAAFLERFVEFLMSCDNWNRLMPLRLNRKTSQRSCMPCATGRWSV